MEIASAKSLPVASCPRSPEREIAGYRDGPAEMAGLNWPRGIVLKGNAILFADFNNHLVRSVPVLTASAPPKTQAGD